LKLFRFLVECVHDLNESLKKVGSQLTVAFGPPERVVADLVQAMTKDGYQIDSVYCQKEVGEIDLICSIY
jgi:deoxyribodipyrimidine photolyase